MRYTRPEMSTKLLVRNQIDLFSLWKQLTNTRVCFNGLSVVERHVLIENIRMKATKKDISGIEVVRGDLSVPSTLDERVNGVEAVFLVWPGLPTSLVPAVLDVFKKHVRRIVYLSSMSALSIFLCHSLL